MCRAVDVKLDLPAAGASSCSADIQRLVLIQSSLLTLQRDADIRLRRLEALGHKQLTVCRHLGVVLLLLDELTDPLDLLSALLRIGAGQHALGIDSILLREDFVCSLGVTKRGIVIGPVRHLRV